MYALQNQNVERKIVKKLDIKENSNKTDTTILINEIIRDNNDTNNINDINDTNDNSDINDINDTNDINDIPQILIPNNEADIFSHLQLEPVINNNYENKVNSSSVI
jgi:hypothetical protein